MKIEKISEHQIRCVLTKDDLESRHIKISELAYGTDKAKSLFQDMMQQASCQFGFEADDLPLMIEAIPISSNKLIILITKVEYPEELDTRFANFAPLGQDDPYDYFTNEENGEEPIPQQEDILGLFEKMAKHHDTASDNKTFTPLGEAVLEGFKDEDANLPASNVNIFKLFTFPNLERLIGASCVVKDFYQGDNNLYKDPKDGKYYLVLSQSSHSCEDFGKICNMMLEYGQNQKYTLVNQAYFDEHFELIIKKDALQELAQLRVSSI